MVFFWIKFFKSLERIYENFLENPINFVLIIRSLITYNVKTMLFIQCDFIINLKLYQICYHFYNKIKIMFL